MVLSIFFSARETTRCFGHEMLLSSVNLGVLGFFSLVLVFIFVCWALVFKSSVHVRTCSLSYFS